MTTATVGGQRKAEATLRSFIARLHPAIQKLGRSVRAAMRKRFPSANELAYDYSGFYVIAYSVSDRAVDAFMSIAARADGVQLYFNRGPELPDPKKLLLGSGRQTRFIRVETARQLAHPDVTALMAAAIDHSGAVLPSKGKGMLIIKTDGSKKKRARKQAE